MLDLDHEVGVRVPLAAGCRVATVGQLLVAPWAWASQPSVLKWSVNEYRLRLGRLRQVCATLLGARHVPECLCGGLGYLGRYNKCSPFCM